jgi:cytochrome P450
MPTAGLAPLDDTITIAELTRDPYPIYQRLRRETPVLRVKSVGRTFLTKAADTKYVKDNAALFSSNDPNTPMKRAFLARTLMRKDHDEHRTERMAMMPALMPKTIESVWAPLYAKLAAAYLDRLPRGEVVDLFPALAGPLAARILAHAMGVPDASDADIQRWSQTLIDGAGNFGWTPGPFEATDIANAEMDRCIRANAARIRAEPDSSALSFMANAKNPIPESQMIANVKIAIGGGINEPRDALLTILYGLLTNPDQLEAVRADGKWRAAFEEGVRWVAPIQASSRLVMEDTEIRGCLIPKGDTVMTIQSTPGLWQRPASLRGRTPVAANRWRHPAAHALRALPPHDLAGSRERTLARIRFPRPAQSAGSAAIGRGTYPACCFAHERNADIGPLT